MNRIFTGRRVFFGGFVASLLVASRCSTMSVRTASARVKQHASGDDDEEAAPGGVVEAVPADAEVYERPSDQPENPDEHFQVPQLPPSMVQDRLYGSEQSPADRRTWPDSAAAWSVQGYRNHMEDEYLIDRDTLANVAIYAVFDGHGGPRCSSFAKQVFSDALRRQINSRVKAKTLDPNAVPPTPSPIATALTTLSAAAVEATTPSSSASSTTPKFVVQTVTPGVAQFLVNNDLNQLSSIMAATFVDVERRYALATKDSPKPREGSTACVALGTSNVCVVCLVG